MKPRMNLPRASALAFLLLALSLSVAFVRAAPKSEKSSADKPAEKKGVVIASPDDVAEDEVEAGSFLPPELAALDESLTYKQGAVVIGDDLATLNVPASWRYLDAPQAERLLTEGWGNPPGTKTLGMLVPADTSPLTPEGWGVVITYQDDGYVSDKDAESINYDELLAQMKKSTAEENEDRGQKGYGRIELVGWAEAPRYDKGANKLYWAQELAFDDSPEHTLNYDIRALGRRGVLSMNAVASMSQLDAVKQGMNDVIGFVEFNKGNRYGEFDSKADKVAAYGLGALVAGKVAAKVGLFKVILGALVAGKKFVVLGVIALAAALRKLFGGKSSE